MAIRRLLPVLGGLPAGAHRLVLPGLLRGMTLTRAQAGGAMSTELGIDGIWRERAADVARFSPSGRLVIEGQRTGGNRNPRMEGVTPGEIGVAGALPTHFSIVTANGMATTVISKVVELGVDLMHVRFAGTASGTQYILQTEHAQQIAATPSQVVGLSWYARVVAAPLPPISHSTRGSSKNSGGANITSATEGFSADGTLRRFSRTATLSSNVGTTFMTLDYRFSTTPGLDYDFTMALGWFQPEPLFPASPILPPVGTPGAATRGADLVSASLASLGIPASGACTLLWSGVLPQAAPAAANQTIFQTDGGANDSSFFARNSAGGSTIVVGRGTGGAFVEAAALGSMAPGAPFAVGMAIDGTGRVAGSFNGGSAQAAAGGPTAGLTTLRLGNDAGGNTPMFGETREFIVIPYALSDANLAARVAALPL